MNSIYIYKIYGYRSNKEQFRSKLLNLKKINSVQIDESKDYLFVTSASDPELDVQLACRILNIAFEGFLGKKELKPKEENIIVTPPDNILFGRYLIENNIISDEIVRKALDKQEEERGLTMKQSPRLLGQILLEDFKALNSRLELNFHLNNYQTYKERMEEIYFEAKTLSKKNKHEENKE